MRGWVLLTTPSLNRAAMLREFSASALPPSPVTEFRGYLLHGRGGEARFLRDEEAAGHLAPRLAGAASPAAIDALLRTLNGGFACFWVEGGRQGVRAATDRAGVVPLYYAIDGGRLLLGGDALEIGRLLGRGVNRRAALAMMAMEFVPGRETLAEGVEQVKPGEVVEFAAVGGRWEARRRAWWEFGFAEGEEGADLEGLAGGLAGRMVEVAEDWAAALVAGHGEGKFAVPLSGGLDSRFLAVLFSRALPGRTVAVSYGDPGSEDVRLAGRVAALAGLPFRQVPFLDGAFLGAPARRTLAEAIGATCRLTLADGGLALAERFGVPTGAPIAGECDVRAFLPGHLGGIISGGKLRTDFPGGERTEELAAAVRPYIGSFAPEVLRGLLRPESRGNADAAGELIRESIRDTGDGHPAVRLQRWYYRELVHRRVMPEMIVYRRRGFPGAPLGDIRLLDFLAGLPAEGLRGQAVYRRAAVDHVFAPLGGDFLRIPVQGRGPLTSPWRGRPLLRRVTNRILRAAAPEHFERRYTSCPMFTLWRRDARLRREVWAEIGNAEVLPRFLDQGRLLDYLGRNLGRDYHLTSLGVWNLLTVELAGRALGGE